MSLPNQTRRVGIALFVGATITLLLSILSRLAVRLFPYRDLPEMPKPFFLYALAPGLIMGEQFDHRWSQECGFYLANSLAYAVAAFCLIAVIRAASRRA